MATKKISELEAINAVEDNDVLVIVDTSESTTNKITKGNLLIGAGHTIEMTLNENYQIVLVLKNAAGTALSTQTIDLPNENAITNLAYNNGILTVTKQSGATSQINLTGLIEGLVTESDFNTFKEALQATLEAINEKDAEQDEAIAENYKVINKLNEKLENQQKVISQLPQVTGQGTSITLENTVEAQFTKFDEEGNSTQETTTGKNKVDVTSGTINIPNMLTLTQNADGTLTLNGNTDNTVYDVIQNMKFTNIVNGNSYKIVTKVKSGTWNAGVIGMRFRDSNAQQIQTLQNSSSSQESKAINGNVNEVRLYFNGSATNLVIEIMLVEASVTDDSFEKFTYGASPNPNYEQPIKSAGDNENIFDGETITFNAYDNIETAKDGLVTTKELSNTGTSNVNIRFPALNLSPDTYYISMDIRIKSGTGNFVKLNDGATDWSVVSKSTISSSFQRYVYKHTYTAEKALNQILVQFSNNSNTIYEIEKIMVSNKASGYSPYGMGSINEKISNKNLCKITDFSKAVANVQIKAENNILSFNGTTNNTISANDAIWKNIKLEVKEKGVYTPSLEKSITGVAFGYYKENSSTLISPYSELEVGSYTLGIYVPANTAFNNFTTGVQIEKGTTATPYVPHKEQDYSIFVQQPMRSIRDVRDCFIKVDGNWYERHYIAEGIFNPYNCGLNGGGTTRLRISMWGYQNLKETLVKSKYFPSINGRWDDNNEIKNAIYSWNSDGVIGVNIDKEIASTLDEFKTWASRVGLNFYYIRKNPLDLPCTEEQIEQLENKPSTYKDFTIIQSEDETPAYLEVAGIYDLNKLITRTEVLESEV